MANSTGGTGRVVDALGTTLVVVIAASAGLTSVFAEASLPFVAGATVAGAVVGIVLVQVALPDTRSDPRIRDRR